MTRLDWRETTLGEVCDQIGGIIQTGPFGSQLHESDYSDDGTPVVMPKDIIEGRIATDGIARVASEHVERLSRHKLKRGDIVYGRRGDIGRQALIKQDEEDWLCGTGCLRISLGDSIVDPLFLHYYLRQELVIGWIANQAIGATLPNLNTSILRSVPLRIPPLPLQRRIAGILSAYDDLIGNNTRRIKILEEMAGTIYREWFVHFRFPGYESISRVASPLGPIPQEWEVTPLSSLVYFAKGRKPAETRREPLPGDIRLLLIDALRGGEAEFASPAKLVIAERRDTIMVMDGASSCDVAIGFSGAVGSTLGRFRTTRPEAFSPHALFRFLEGKAEEFKSKNIGAAIPHANKDYILSQPIALPPQAIAWRFHSHLEPIQSTIEILKSEIQNLRRTRDLLLPRLLSGR